ncbi:MULTISPECIES: hypothetical protein [unclassified Bradyrhizobium]|uniref:hypothetical protein n=1 Tax=unclassified Bradyrhizobium TaxID=2631580 RepID=UPI0028E61673|nr:MULTISPECIES: hypothetical protein [unclassified Bradyrhizobium]
MLDDELEDDVDEFEVVELVAETVMANSGPARVAHAPGHVASLRSWRRLQIKRTARRIQAEKDWAELFDKTAEFAAAPPCRRQKKPIDSALSRPAARCPNRMD